MKFLALAFALATGACGMAAAQVAIADPTTASAADSTFPAIPAADAYADYMIFNVTGPYPTFSFAGSETNKECSTVRCCVAPGSIPTGTSPKESLGRSKGPCYLGLDAAASGNTTFFPSAEFTVTGIPEASTWAMLVLGFTCLGYAAFRRGAKSRAAGRSL